MRDVLLVDDDPSFVASIERVIEGEGVSFRSASSVSSAREELEKRLPDLLFVDLMLPDGNGLELLEDLPDRGGMRVVVLTGNPSLSSAIKAIRGPIDDYLLKPVGIADIRSCLHRLGAPAERVEVGTADPEKYGIVLHFGRLIGESEPMHRVYEAIHQIAPSSAAVLIQGESGTGKELVALAVHEISRRQGAFVPLNCGALQPSLMGSELFGHEKGSFTGATRRHEGYFERASGGTLFLDEITEMPLEHQSHLLRALETKEITRLGGTTPIRLDVRVIAATNRDPLEAIGDGYLREDLYYRICEFPIALPPLRARPGDIELMCRFFIASLNEEYGAEATLDEESMERLKAHDLRGNVRELRQILRRAFLQSLGKSTEIAIDDSLLTPLGPPMYKGLAFRPGTPLKDVERALIDRTLEHYGGNRRKTAEALGISLRTLYNRLREETQDEQPEG